MQAALLFRRRSLGSSIVETTYEGVKVEKSETRSSESTFLEVPPVPPTRRVDLVAGPPPLRDRRPDGTR